MGIGCARPYQAQQQLSCEAVVISNGKREIIYGRTIEGMKPTADTNTRGRTREPTDSTSCCCVYPLQNDMYEPLREIQRVDADGRRKNEKKEKTCNYRLHAFPVPSDYCMKELSRQLL